MVDAWQVGPADNVATMLRDVAGGDAVALGTRSIIADGDIARGHKIALKPIDGGQPIIKFGFPIGVARHAIALGAHVHVDNVATALTGTVEYAHVAAPPRAAACADDLQFQGYVRADGRVGTRNEIWILPTVGCVARTAQRIAGRAHARHVGTVDGVHAFAHPFGCSQLGDDLAGTRRILAALACHPNAGGVLIIGLGCESNQLAALLAEVPEARRGAIRTMIAQSSPDEMAEGEALVDELVAQAAQPRVAVGLDKLALGVKCGGSDGFSGLTANPLVGRMSDRIAGAGGTVILTEIPEIFGAEQVLMARAASRAVFDRIGAMVNDFIRYFLSHGEPVSENPSPGNIAGGITTLEEKSLGAVQKGGNAPVVDAIGYGAQATLPGLTLLEAPGNDAVSTTALAAAGATLILFTTGRGTPLGAPVPTLKIASNSALAAAKPGWIDFDAGAALDDGMEPSADALLARIIAIASGAETAAERNEEREMAIWKRGVTL
ncbi:altronate dehydratase family protein [Sphingomonas sp.]|uniref:UxaA family hydrolase n=1 Tax=Sphingomonas sp. TaxID=28214 RepID=UPI00333EE38E